MYIAENEITVKPDTEQKEMGESVDPKQPIEEEPTMADNVDNNVSMNE